MPDVQFILAGIPLTDVQIPEKMPWGGDHKFGIHKLPGGKRVFDAMGPDNRPITWTGLFYGPLAVSIARAFDVLRQNGAPVTLQWGPFNFLVVIKSFKPDFERVWQITYQIDCEIVQDNSAPNSLSPDSVDDVVRADMTNVLNQAQSLGMNVPGDLPGPVSTLTGAPGSFPTAISAPAGSVLNLGGVASALTSLRSAMSRLTSFVGVTPTTILPVATSLIASRNAVAATLVTSELALGVSDGVGGVGVFGTGLARSATFASYSAIAIQAPLLRNMGSCLRRMQVNLEQGAS
jgi:hypothetical protein